MTVNGVSLAFLGPALASGDPDDTTLRKYQTILKNVVDEDVQMGGTSDSMTGVATRHMSSQQRLARSKLVESQPYDQLWCLTDAAQRYVHNTYVVRSAASQIKKDVKEHLLTVITANMRAGVDSVRGFDPTASPSLAGSMANVPNAYRFNEFDANREVFAFYGKGEPHKVLSPTVQDALKNWMALDAVWDAIITKGQLRTSTGSISVENFEIATEGLSAYVNAQSLAANYLSADQDETKLDDAVYELAVSDHYPIAACLEPAG
jgi:hypothetical protein